MSLGKTEVEYISRLAAIDVNESEVDDVAAKLSNILDLFSQMQAADTDNVSPMAHPLDQVQRLRPDVVTESDQHEKLQSVAPAVENGLYLVPQVIE
ncbi:Asp-tRNA(Asn)/Glu-tRNA(Gln) amidotransferase subunit GatC [Thiomicrorhabdus lithotrophica]|uniref:Aspartyl/glutamyl-tRNA(Asn/Gln) amidotransferase subunit C n=1 Tax=Thiomicrorhabdus lithotrophica TaxID=2949997 RepID=A0ABY8CCR3_9GAMM|nr:Asp-tRNA(Asn)/Glu-tRNA(Gln) amidotransferase subunit GatC [Thiomicrorhabdus lithotrophica]MEA1989857.1 Asp-tRNA(Asn)/Glu-tRNA(Gln) amidotransferase subunit GatC [Pseudomonadota bacterium]WEJ63267.1 Asp-tRNA(Asn)/Glu-tRNA(Gln) amidotransferase subunit GatC [Thiomicrorhabdus lithotrophica]